MINRIFFDLDETLLHTIFDEDPCQKCFEHIDDFDERCSFKKMYTIFNPDAKSLLKFSRDLVGNENVYILTSSLKAYATRLCQAGDFGFRSDQIFSREDLDNHRAVGAYGGSYHLSSKLADPNNVLIDDLPPRNVENKLSFAGIKDWQNRFIAAHPYYGVNFPDNDYADEIIEKLKSLHK
jgi:hypothetical protein